MCCRAQAPPKIAASKMLLSGPTTAITASMMGRGGSRSKRETPPKIKRVMPRTGMPLLWAMTLWLSSWVRTDKKNRITVTIATVHRWATGQCNLAFSNSLASKKVSSKKTNTQLTLTSIGMPKTRPKRSEAPNFQ